jgi:hypothetical protein
MCTSEPVILAASWFRWLFRRSLMSKSRVFYLARVFENFSNRHLYMFCSECFGFPLQVCALLYHCSLLIVFVIQETFLPIPVKQCSFGYQEGKGEKNNFENFNVNYHSLRGPGSSVGIETDYGLDCPEIESRWGRDFSHTSRPVLGPTQPPVQWGSGLSRG